AVELHRVHRTTLGLGPQVADVPEHLRQRDESTDDLDPARVLHRLDLTSPGVQVADDISHVLLRSTDLDVHERLEEDGLRLAQSLLGSHGAGDLDRKSTRLNSSHVKISYAVFCLKKKNNN